MLVIFAGLPGVGKTTIARELARRISAVYLRADTIEQGMRECGLGDNEIGGTGYVVGYRLASENLRLGNRVVADTVNPWGMTREAWRDVARAADSRFLDVEVVCRDAEEHRRRVESRQADIKGFPLPTWSEVVDREYHEWDQSPLRIDTSSIGVEEAVQIILKGII